jgi:polyhydroxyalkanoate synthesis regulator phasin
MENLTDTFKKAFYLGVGLASYAGEQVGDIQGKAQELADDLIRRGEDTTNEASKFLNVWMAQTPNSAASSQEGEKPQKIEILSVEDVEDINSDPKG